MKEPIQLATMTIDLHEVSGIDERDNHILVVFSSAHVPESLTLTGADAEAMHQWLEADRQRYIADRAAQGEIVPPDFGKKDFTPLINEADIPF